MVTPLTMGGDTAICCQRSLASLRSTLRLWMSLKAGSEILKRVVVALVVTQPKSTSTVKLLRRGDRQRSPLQQLVPQQVAVGSGGPQPPA